MATHSYVPVTNKDIKLLVNIGVLGLHHIFIPKTEAMRLIKYAVGLNKLL